MYNLKQVMFLSLYRTAVTLIFHLLGFHANMTSNRKYDLTVQTLVFSAFVFARLFNSVNCRSPDYYFMVITFIEIGTQILFVLIGGSSFSTTLIGGREWGISLAFGVVSIPLAGLILSEPFKILFKWLGLLGKTEIPLITVPILDTVGWNVVTRDSLNVGGGRVRSPSFFQIKRRTARLGQDRGRPVSLLPMVSRPIMDVNQGCAQTHCLSDPIHDRPASFQAERPSFPINKCRTAGIRDSSHGGEASFKNSSFPDAHGPSLQGAVLLEAQYPFEMGGNSHIYKGKLFRSNGQTTQVAIKMILGDSGFEQSSDSLRRLQREAYIWERFKHENLVPFFGISYDVAPWPVLVSPLYDFGHVGTFLEKHPTANRLEMVLGVASGVEYLHANDVVHGDLKVSNVLVDDRGVPRISDFGISKILNLRGFTTPRANVGTLPYMAPELFWISSDVYSFGLLALEILTSESPKRRPTRPFATVEMFAELRPKRTDYENAIWVSADTWAVFDKCWAFAPEVRPSISDVRQQLSSAFTRIL
ncbi:kinase-like domain-containing protein [Mycena pura]|uniref:Kinase-like domain-containing protein n=1 Tax=Mycena pura TaxID=153505 RepID=A0AAD6XZ83_9AGAR|nr:kinase-like domain-containing protein [Mycena pura]